QDNKLPASTSAALDQLQPTGSKPLGGAQVIRVGTSAPVAGYKTTDVSAGNPAALAAALDKVRSAAAGGASHAVVVASQDRSEYAMPAAGWAAKSGDPVLWVTANAVPPETTAAIKTRHKPAIYVLGPADAVSDTVLRQLEKLGKVKRIAASDPV